MTTASSDWVASAPATAMFPVSTAPRPCAPRSITIARSSPRDSAKPRPRVAATTSSGPSRRRSVSRWWISTSATSMRSRSRTMERPRMARPSATRCRCPPGRAAGRRARSPPRPSMPAACATRRSTSTFGVPQRLRDRTLPAEGPGVNRASSLRFRPESATHATAMDQSGTHVGAGQRWAESRLAPLYRSGSRSRVASPRRAARRPRASSPSTRLRRAPSAPCRR